MVWIQFYDEEIVVADTKSEAITKMNNQIKKEHPLLTIELTDKNVFHLEPSKKVVDSLFTFGKDFTKNIILSSQSPQSLGFSKNNFFTIIVLKGDLFPFTKEQKSLNIEDRIMLQERLGLSINVTKKTLEKDLAGATKLKESINHLLWLEKIGLSSISALFLFGVAGAGKSHTAECLAGTTGRHYAILDLPYYMTLPSPTKSVDELFDFLESQDERFLLLLDEIEKMFDFKGENLIAKQVFGKLLSRLSDLYGKPNNNIVFVATANNITDILMFSPEFLRKGRFDELYFLGYPRMADAEEVFNMYIKINKKKISGFIERMYDKYSKLTSTQRESATREEFLIYRYMAKIEDDTHTKEEVINFFWLDFHVKANIRYVDSLYKGEKVSDGDRFVYSPPEIQAFTIGLQNHAIKEVLEMELALDSLDKTKGMGKYEDNDIYSRKIASAIIPLQFSAAEGISKQIAQSKYFGSGKTEFNIFKDV